MSLSAGFLEFSLKIKLREHGKRYIINFPRAYVNVFYISLRLCGRYEKYARFGASLMSTTSLLIITFDMDIFTIDSVVFMLELLDRCTKGRIFSGELSYASESFVHGKSFLSQFR